MTIDRAVLIAAIGRLNTAMARDFDLLNTADGALGDGDLGITMTRGMSAISENIENLPDDLGMALLQCAQAFTKASGSSYGTLLATGSPNKRVDLWQIPSGEKIQTWQVTPREGSKPKSAVVLDVTFTDNGKSLLTESSSGIAERFIIRENNEHN